MGGMAMLATASTHRYFLAVFCAVYALATDGRGELPPLSTDLALTSGAAAGLRTMRERITPPALEANRAYVSEGLRWLGTPNYSVAIPPNLGLLDATGAALAEGQRVTAAELRHLAREERREKQMEALASLIRAELQASWRWLAPNPVLLAELRESLHKLRQWEIAHNERMLALAGQVPLFRPEGVNRYLAALEGARLPWLVGLSLEAQRRNHFLAGELNRVPLRFSIRNH
jgi:hypothetical protein